MENRLQKIRHIPRHSTPHLKVKLSLLLIFFTIFFVEANHFSNRCVSSVTSAKTKKLKTTQNMGNIKHLAEKSLSVIDDAILVQGIVKDEKNAPLAGASVTEKGTENGALTDLDGKFQLNVASEKSIRSSSVRKRMILKTEKITKTST